MMSKQIPVLLVWALLVAVPVAAQGQAAPPVVDAAAEAPEGAEVADGAEEAEPGPTPTPANRSFECAVDSAGERCTVPISEGDEVDGVVAYREEHTGKWVDFGWGPFNPEGQPHGCDWVLEFRERLVEERGCFENGKRHGTWETCRLRLNQKTSSPNLKCPKTEYESGVVVVKLEEPEPEPELVEEEPGEGEEGAEGEETADGKERASDEADQEGSRKPATKKKGA